MLPIVSILFNTYIATACAGASAVKAANLQPIFRSNMPIKLKYQPYGVHFAVFFALAVGMFIVNMIFTHFFFKDILDVFATDQEITPAMVSKFKWMQVIAAIMTFVMPPVLYGYLSNEKPLEYVGLRPGMRFRFAFATFLLWAAVMPMAMLMGDLNQQADFGSMNELVKNMEGLYEKIIEKFMVMNGPTDLVINLFVVALLPAVSEELFFRGALQNILEKWTKSAIVSIGLASLGFALLHGTILKFLPILVLGITLGTIFYVTRNLWYSILFHFLNNSMALIASYYAQRNDFMKQLNEDEVKLNWWVGLISLAVTIGIFVFLRKGIPYQPAEIRSEQPPSPHDDFLSTPR